MNTSCRCLAILLAAALALPAPRGHAEVESRNQPAAAAGSNWVCVVNKVSEVPGQYCTYNAIRCPFRRASLDHQNCGLTRGDCNNAMNDTNCFDIPESFLMDSSFHPVDGGLQEKGLTKILQDSFVPKLHNGATILLNQLAQLDLPDGSKIKVRLFLIKAQYQNKFYQFVGQGVEVKSDKKADLIIEKESAITFKGQACFLDLGSVKYTAILSTKVKAKPKNEKEPPLLQSELRQHDPRSWLSGPYLAGRTLPLQSMLVERMPSWQMRGEALR